MQRKHSMPRGWLATRTSLHLPILFLTAAPTRDARGERVRSRSAVHTATHFTSALHPVWVCARRALHLDIVELDDVPVPEALEDGNFGLQVFLQLSLSSRDETDSSCSRSALSSLSACSRDPPPINLLFYFIVSFGTHGRCIRCIVVCMLFDNKTKIKRFE